MKILSYGIVDGSFEKIEVEVLLLQGPPGIQILGLPDTLVKESAIRVPAALMAQGFDVPITQRVFVNLRPLSVKKSSDSLDLAIALGILWETQQIAPWPRNTDPVVIGELGLSGSIEGDTEAYSCLPFLSGDVLISPCHKDIPVEHVPLKQLKDLRGPYQFVSRTTVPMDMPRPEFSKIIFSKQMSEWLLWLAVGEHHSLLAGLPGTGKSTFAIQLWSLLKQPTESSFKEALLFHRSLRKTLNWRPLIQPHHSVSALAIAGGGRPIRPGAVTMAHGGMLLLDEYLEFSPEVQEALREPLAEKKIHILRGSEYKSFPADFLLLATTNLCPCGKWLPRHLRKSNVNCRCGQGRVLNYQSRLRGPVLDRFECLFYFDTKPTFQGSSMEEIFERAEEIRNFTAGKSYSVDEESSEFIKSREIPMRRQNSLQRLALTIAHCDMRLVSTVADLRKAYPYTVGAFEDWL